MKTFEDLEFVGAPFHSGSQAQLTFENGYGVSVISGDMAYSDEENPYEVAVLYNGSLCYNTHITDDVLGYQTEEQVTKVMRKVQELEVEVKSSVKK